MEWYFYKLFCRNILINNFLHSLQRQSPKATVHTNTKNHPDYLLPNNGDERP